MTETPDAEERMILHFDLSQKAEKRYCNVDNTHSHKDHRDTEVGSSTVLPPTEDLNITHFQQIAP